MREIKFRAWDSKYKIMRYGGDLFSSGVLHFQYYHPEEQGIEMGDAMRNLENPMQFTGLHDKNGKDIYEGDIVRIICKEYWAGRGEKIDTFIKEIEYVDEIAGFMPFNDGLYPSNDCIYEVIGNVWETPELLKEGK